MPSVAGTCDPKFTEVRAALERNLASGNELGASIAIWIDGRPVVDMWGGVADAETGQPWAQDTITNVWSCTKTVTALAALMLVDRGLLDLDAPVARYWPEFAANGKDGVLVRHLLSHTSGVSGWDKPFDMADLVDTTKATERLAGQAPWWEPGTASGYHALNYGHLLGEVLRRIDGRSLTAFVAEEIAGPLDADFRLGVGRADYPRVAPVVPPPPLPIDLATMDPDSIMIKTFTAPMPDAAAAWTDAWRESEVGAANGHSNARALARIQSVIACGGELDGVRLLGRDTIDTILDEQSNGVDLVLAVPIRFGVGFGLPSPESVPYIPEGRICFWGGWGGSSIVIDTDRRMTFAYTMNKMGPGVLGSDRTAEYTAAAFAAVG